MNKPTERVTERRAPKHTPTPWSIDDGLNGIRIRSDTGATIATVHYMHTGREAADAALIVRAVNAHEALVRAGREAALCFGYGPESEAWWESKAEDQAAEWDNPNHPHGSDGVRLAVLDALRLAFAIAEVKS